MKRFVFTVNLKDDPEAIEMYKSLHKSMPEDVVRNIPKNGIRKMDIYIIGRRLVNIIETDDDFNPEFGMKRVNIHPKIKEWDEITGALMEPLPEAKVGEKWSVMENIYHREN